MQTFYARDEFAWLVCFGLCVDRIVGDILLDHSKRIRGLRTRLGLNQQQFAAKLGVSQGTVSRWESEQQVPSIDALLEMQRLGKFEESDLIEDVRITFSDSFWGREINLVGAVQSNRLVDAVEWPEYEWIKINAPDVTAWKNLQIKAYAVLESPFGNIYRKDSVVFITPFVFNKLEVRQGDKILFADYNDRRKKYEIIMGEIKNYENKLSLNWGSSSMDLPYANQFEIANAGGYEAAGFIGLVIGGFSLEDPERLAADINNPFNDE